jgi:hypothetical protein
MGFMDKVKETAAKGTEMAKGAAKAGQEKIDEQKTKKKISDLKEELGGIVYAQRTGTPAANAVSEIERIVGEIKEAEEALASVGDEGGVGDAAPDVTPAPAPADDNPAI